MCRMCVWPGVAWVLEVRAALEQQKLYLRRARGAGVGSTLLGVCWARGAWEEWFRAWVSLQLGDSRRKTAWSWLFGAVWLCVVGRYGSPESDRPRARRSISSTNGETFHLKPLPSSVAAGVRSEGSIVISSRCVGVFFRQYTRYMYNDDPLRQRRPHTRTSVSKLLTCLLPDGISSRSGSGD